MARLKRWVLVGVALALLGAGRTAQAQGPPGSGGPFGLGIILGEPTGITGKYWFNDEGALDFHLAWDFTDDAIAIFVDYLFHLDIGVHESGFDLPLYIGVGGKLSFHDHDFGDHHHHDHGDDDHVHFGIRIPVGLAMLLRRAPVEIFVEIAPGIRLIPDTDFDIDGGIGVRYYF